MDWYPWFPLAFRRKTYRLSLAEDGAYRRLIDEYMLNRTAIPDDDTALARILGVGLSDWLAVAPEVRPFFRPQNGLLTHRRCDQEIRAQNMRIERFSARGKKAAFAKYNKNNAQHTKRMLVPPTLHNNSNSSLEASKPSAPPVPPKEQAKEGSIPVSQSLLETMRRKQEIAGYGR